MTRADLEKHLATGECAKIADYVVRPVPAVKGKHGIVKKAAYFHVSMALQNGFEQDFATLDEVLACAPGTGKTIEEMLKDVNCLRFPFC